VLSTSYRELVSNQVSRLVTPRCLCTSIISYLSRYKSVSPVVYYCSNVRVWVLGLSVVLGWLMVRGEVVWVCAVQSCGLVACLSRCRVKGWGVSFVWLVSLLLLPDLVLTSWPFVFVECFPRFLVGLLLRPLSHWNKVLI
jgi:hypothetical protein